MKQVEVETETQRKARVGGQGGETLDPGYPGF
jgi:hypothetical protein